ncbi:MAG: prolyl oligopeptidase family serine peptidase [Niastella sp.]|uniref:carboxylesterase family protein n=1 Tax=Niastella sp. TaxID=1869183 RepID=UPI003899F611
MLTRRAVPHIVVAIVAILSAIDIKAQVNNNFSPQFYTNGKGDTLFYRQLNPDANPRRHYPLLIFLHGSGERGSDNAAQLKWGVMNFATEQNLLKYPAVIITPQCPANTSWADPGRDRSAITAPLSPSPTKTMTLLLALIKKFKAEGQIDTSRIYITGLSMGGFGTFDAIEREPDLFAAAVPVCGGGDPAKASSLVKLPIWIFTGSEDPAVNPEFSLNMLQALWKGGARPGFTMLPEVGHFSWLGAYTDPLMIEWLFRQHK